MSLYVFSTFGPTKIHPVNVYCPSFTNLSPLTSWSDNICQDQDLEFEYISQQHAFIMNLSPEHLNDLSHIIKENCEKERAPLEMYQLANEFAENLAMTLQNERIFQGKEIMAHVFGSLRNGLGTKNSDMDICLRIIGTKEAPEELLKKTTVLYLQHIIEPLKKKFNCVVEPVLKAAVPILKIKWRPPQRPNMVLEGEKVISGVVNVAKFKKLISECETDLSVTFYHALSLQHADLIKAYCDWDPRVEQLGLFLKKWSKSSGIGSSGEGYLSSFAWSLMLIQYMQVTQPPVVANLQKIGRKVVLERKYNVYFYRGSNPEPFLWQKNDTSLGALFVGFLQYYANYDFINKKIGIDSNTRTMQNHFEWRAIVISDPFTGQYFGIEKNDYEKRRDNVIRCLQMSYEAFTSMEIRLKYLSLRSDNYNRYLGLYEDALLQACPKIVNTPTKLKFFSNSKHRTKAQKRLFKEQRKQLKEQKLLDEATRRLAATGIAIKACA